MDEIGAWENSQERFEVYSHQWKKLLHVVIMVNLKHMLMSGCSAFDVKGKGSKSWKFFPIVVS